MAVADLDQALETVFDFAGVRQPGHDSPAAMVRAMELLGDPQERLLVAHVAGTSGKTSTSYFLRAMLQAGGLVTGMTISPHIRSLNERVQIDGEALDEAEFCTRTEHLLARLSPLRGQLTYFELMVSLAFDTFADKAVDVAVVEVGIGGSRDATNIARRRDKVSLIAPVGLDHTEKLGHTIAEIAAHKAGILVPGGRGVVAPQCDEARAVIEARARQIGARLDWVDPTTVAWPEDLPTFQRGNFALARAGLNALAETAGFPLPGETQMAALRSIAPPARFEWFDLGDHRVLLDGAHNPPKMRALVEALSAQQLGPFPVLATLSSAGTLSAGTLGAGASSVGASGVGAGKIADTLAALSPLVTHLIVPEFVLGHDSKIKESVPAAHLAAVAAGLGIDVEIVADLPSAWQCLLAQPTRDLLVTGSLYLAALVRPWLSGKRG